MTKIRIFVADDHPAFREGLCRCLSDEEDLEVVGSSEDGEEAVRMAGELLPDVVIVDVAMPKLDGIEATRQIKARCPNAAVLIISAYNYQSYLLASMRAGASGYLLKSAPISELVNTIRMVHSGSAVFDFKAVGKILRRIADDGNEESGGLEELQPRELEVLKQVARGISNREIASSLGISERTVQSHLVNIFKKLGVGSRTEAVLHALKEGWLTLDDLP
ncbi:MAG: response regulator transcription factor [Chloroflexota bacterium]|nr:response regulator transcription factor [Chloroflexota bacterium]